MFASDCSQLLELGNIAKIRLRLTPLVKAIFWAVCRFEHFKVACKSQIKLCTLVYQINVLVGISVVLVIFFHFVGEKFMLLGKFLNLLGEKWISVASHFIRYTRVDSQINHWAGSHKYAIEVTTGPQQKIMTPT